MMVEPIGPNDDRLSKGQPDKVIEAFNELIVKYWDGGQAKFKQDEVVRLIGQKMGVPDNEIFESHYLDVEHIYRAEGWKVEYDKPGYNEDYPPTFTFSKIKRQPSYGGPIP